MMRARILALAPVLALSVSSLTVSAAEAPKPGYGDVHIQSVAYDPDQVVVLQGTLGYQMMVEFGPGERLVSVSIGDAMGWQVVPNRDANLLFLKPLHRDAATNMSVVTNQRRYAFDLRVLPKKTRQVAPYAVRFIYPPVAVAVAIPRPPPPPEAPPEQRNRAYVATGAPANVPSVIFDDGRMTYFAWPAQAAVPAIFAVGTDGKEAIVNYTVQGPYTVVEQLAPRFVLRNGKQVTQVVNRGFVTPAATVRTGAR